MAGNVSVQVAQRDLHGAVATIYRAEGWLVVELHQNKTNPKQMSGPDFLMIRGEVALAVKCLARPGDNLSAEQAKVRKAYEALPCVTYVVYNATSFEDIVTDARDPETNR